MSTTPPNLPSVTYGKHDPVAPVNTSINVDAEVLRALGAKVAGTDGQGGLVGDISTQVSTIFSTLQELELGWAGATQAEAEDFFTRLEACMTTAFGNEKNPESEKTSVIARTAQALSASGANYLHAEDVIIKEFTDFSNQMNGNGSSSPQPDDGVIHGTAFGDPSVTAISETY
ncbi:WXG100 family type VII secretion target [Streptomyces sp. NPDC050161]|uniref:WXG100 family type VII secretion target n=1 Tax=Streptomyces sp. NPDC050161 TaxID=3365604 RepID=UPI0037BACC89